MEQVSLLMTQTLLGKATDVLDLETLRTHLKPSTKHLCLQAGRSVCWSTSLRMTQLAMVWRTSISLCGIVSQHFQCFASCMGRSMCQMMKTSFLMEHTNFKLITVSYTYVHMHCTCNVRTYVRTCAPKSCMFRPYDNSPTPNQTRPYDNSRTQDKSGQN